MSNIYGQSATVLGIDRRIARVLVILTVVMIPILFFTLMLAVSSPADIPTDIEDESYASKYVIESYTDILSSPLDYLIIAMVFAMTLLIGVLFFLNEKYHYIVLLGMLVTMALVNLFVIWTNTESGLSFPNESLLAVLIVFFGFGFLPTFLAFILGGSAILALSSRNRKLREDSFAEKFNVRFTQVGGFQIWKPRLFFLTIGIGAVMLLGSVLFPQTEFNDSTSLAYKFILGLILFWAFTLIMMQLVFNLAQGILKPGLLTFKHSPRPKKRQRVSRKSSIQNIRQPRKRLE